MTSTENNENININIVPKDENKENFHNNLDEFINKQINIAKNHKAKQNQEQITKCLGVLDQNNNCIKRTGALNVLNPEVINEKPNLLMPLDINALFLKNNLLNPNCNNNNIFDYSNSNNNDEENPQNISKEIIDLSSKSNSEIEMISSLKEKESDKILLFSSPNFIEKDFQSESEHNKISENLQNMQNSLIPLNINIDKMFNKRESNNLLLKCGESSYKYNKILEESVFNIPPNFLCKQKVSPYIRTKMVDWMIEVLSIFEASEETFFLSVNIMDLFFWKTPTTFRNETVHLIGVACMFIASKFQEIYPISLKEFVHRIDHDQFNEEEIKKMECKIFKDIKPECLVSTSVYDFSKTYFYDFYYNNKNLIVSKEDGKIYEYIKMTSIYLNKLVLHYEVLYQEKCSIKAIACIVTSMKIVGDNLKDKFSQKTRGIYNDWMLFLIEQGGFDKKKVENLASSIYKAYSHYQNSKSISKNLNRFYPLPYINKRL